MTAGTWESVQTPDIETIGWAFALGFIFIAVGLVQSSDPPAGITGWRIAAGMVLFGLLLLTVDTIQTDHHREWTTVIPSLLAGGLLLILLFRYQSPTMPMGSPTAIELLFLAGLLGVFLLGGLDRGVLTHPQMVLIGMFALVGGLFLYHTTTTGTTGPSWPVWAVVVSGVSLLLIPRYVPIQSFLWSVSVLAGLASIVTIYAFLAGEFTFLGFEVTYNRQNFPFTHRYPEGWYGITSIFNNINVFGLVAFAGLSTAVFTLHKAVVNEHRIAPFIAGGLVVINGIGLLLSSSGASLIAAGVTLGFFAVYLGVGRRAVLPAFVGGTVLGGLAMAIAYLGYLPVNDGGRFDRWLSGIRAILDNPSWLGHGFISTAEFTAPYTEEMGYGTPHNSYLSMLIRMGFLGGIAYIILLWGTMAYRTITIDTTDVAMLAFTLGWAVHHLFESYTIVQWTPAAVLSAMALGYLLFATDGPDAASTG